MAIDENNLARFDGTLTDLISGGLFHNQQTGMGMPLRDSALHTRVGMGDRLSELELRRLYRYDWLVGRIIDIPASDMTRAGFRLTIHDGTVEDVKRVMSAYKRIKARKAFKQAYKWASLFGGSAIVIKTNGDDDLEKPIVPKRLRSIDKLVVLDRHQITPDPEDWNLLEPEYYRLVQDADLYTAKGEQLRYGKRIHHSRVLRFDGVELPTTDRRYNEGWGDSKLNRIGEVLKRYRTVGSSILAAIQSFSILGVEMRGLSGLVAAGKTPQIKEYLQEVSRSLSLYGVLLTDAERATSEFKGRNLGSVEGLFSTVFRDELTACTGLPFIKLWGEMGRAGLSDDGGAESRHYAETIRSQQEDNLYDNDRTLLSWLMQIELGNEPDSWDLEYNSLFSLDEETEAKIKKLEADTYEVLIRSGAATPDEVRKVIGSDQDLESAIVLEDEEPSRHAEPEKEVEESVEPKEDAIETIDVEGEVLTEDEFDELGAINVLQTLENILGAEG
jgi:phage-related protein (TIGR01555 family)